MTQQDLADAAGVDLKTVYNLESGTRWPIARTRVAISRALGWSGDGLARLVAAAGYETPPPALLPAVEATARQAGINPHDPDDPWMRPVRDEIKAAQVIHGGHASGSQVFYGSAASATEASIFDDRSLNETSKVVAIAVLRAWRARDEAGRRNHGRSGRAGLAPLVTLARG